MSETAILVEPTQAHITILENDYPYGLFEFEDTLLSGIETPPDTSPYNSIEFRVNRERGTFGSVSINWAFSSDDAGLDVSPTYGTLTFIEGQDYRDITVYIIPDNIPEDIEILTIVLHSPTRRADILINKGQVCYIYCILLFVYLFICLFVCLFACLFVGLFFVFLFFCDVIVYI